MRAYIHPTCVEEVEAEGSVEHLVVEAADVKLGAQFFWARAADASEIRSLSQVG